MRVGLLVGSGNPAFGGVERHVTQVANGLVAAGHEAFVVTGAGGPIGVDRGLARSVEICSVPVPDGPSFPRFAGAALRCFRQRRPCIAHSHLTYGLATGVLVRLVLRTPLVHTEHFVTRKSADRGLRGRVGAALRGRADALIFVSKLAQDGCPVSGGSPIRHVIYNGVDISPMPESLRDAKRLVYVGRLEPDKRVDVVLDIARALRGEGYTLDLVGTGALEADLRARASDLVAAGIVRFHGWQNEVEPIVRGAGALVLPAHEGLSYAAVEAAAQGVPVVAPSASGTAELIKTTGWGSLVMEDGRLDLWVAAVRDASGLSAAAPPLPQVFQSDHMVRATLDVYEYLWRERLVPSEGRSRPGVQRRSGEGG